MGHYDECYEEDDRRLRRDTTEQNKAPLKKINSLIEKIEDEFSELTLSADGEEAIRSATHKLVELKALIKYSTEI